MTAGDHRALRAELGAYVLQQLSPAEARRVEEHLLECGLCRAERDELVPVVSALADLRSDGGTVVDDGLDLVPPRHLGERVATGVRDAERSERRRGWMRSAAFVTAGAAAASVVLAATVGLGDAPTPAAAPLEAVAVDLQEAGITAEAGLVAHTWGVEVKLTATGFARGDQYRVVVVGDDGRDHPAGGFVGTGAAEMRCNLNSTVLRDRAAGFEVLDSRGQVVAASRFEA